MKKARDYRLASTFLRHIDERGITYKKLKEVLFGEHSIAFIKAIRKHGQVAFKDIKKAHLFMYMVEVGIEECIKKNKKPGLPPIEPILNDEDVKAWEKMKKEDKQ